MENAATKKFNLPKETTYLEMPRDFFGKTKAGETDSPFEGLSPHSQLFLAAIHTENKIEGRPAKIVYADLIARFGGSKGTYARHKQILIDKGIIEEGERSHYTIIAPYNPKSFIKIKDCLFKEEFEMTEDGNPNKKRHWKSRRRLTRKSIILASFIENMERNGEFISSQSRIGVALGFPRTTAGDGIRELTSARAMKCSAPTDPRKISAGLTKYEIDDEIKAVKYIKGVSEKAVEAVKSTFKKQVKPREQEKNNDKTDPQQELVNRVEKYFYDLRYKAEARAEAVLAKATSDKIYGEIKRQLSSLSIKCAFESDPQRLQELETERNILRVKGDKRLKELGIDKAEFEPRYSCKACNDTGYTQSGEPCKCRIRLIKRIENNEI